MPSSIGRRFVAGLAGMALCLTLAPAVAAADPGGATVVASGLDNPRGIDVGANGRVFVAEAGTGRILQVRGTTVST